MDSSGKLLALNVRRLREKHGWTQAELAEKCDLSIAMIQKIEHARTNPSLQTLDIICRVLTVGPADLYQGDLALMPDLTSAAEFLAKYQDLSPVLQRLVMSLVYQDDRYARGVKLNAEALAEVQKLFGPMLKAR